MKIAIPVAKQEEQLKKNPHVTKILEEVLEESITKLKLAKEIIESDN